MQSKLAGSATPATSGRPSLYTESTLQAGPVQSGSILAGLESARSGMKSRKALIASALLIVLGGAGWFIIQSGPSAAMPENQAPAAGPVTIPPAANMAIAAAPLQANASAPMMADAGATALQPAPAMPAVVVAQEEPIVQAESQVAHEQSLSAKEELVPSGVAAVQAQLPVAVPAVARNSAGTEPARPASAAPSPAEKSPLAVATRPVAKAAVPDKPVATAAARPASGATAAKTGEKDGDVELIAALLNRVSNKTDAASGHAVSKPRPDAVRKSAASATQKKSRKNAGSRESAGPKPVDTAQAQLERCNALGFFEAEMCRLRTCTGRWGSDPGCPEYAEISSVGH